MYVANVLVIYEHTTFFHAVMINCIVSYQLSLLIYYNRIIMMVGLFVINFINKKWPNDKSC